MHGTLDRNALSAADRIGPKPPWSPEAEQALLGCLLIWNGALDSVSDVVEADHFFDPLHQQIFDAISKLIGQNQLASVKTLKGYFDKAEPIDQTTTVPQYLGKLTANASTTINARNYAQIIRDLWVRRQLILLSDDIGSVAYDSPVDFPPEVQIEQAQARLFALSSRESNSNNVVVAEDVPITMPDDGPIAGLIGPRSTVVWYGPSGAGKSTLVIDAMHAICTGRPWMGRRTRPCSVLYVPLEGRDGVGARLAAVRAEHGDLQGRLGVYEGTIELGRAATATSGTPRLIVAARSLEHKSGMPVGLIVIDTYARALAGDDENDAAAVAAVMAQTAHVSAAAGTAVLLIGHPGKDRDRGLRGSYALYGAVDSVVEIERAGDAPTRNVIARKVRDGAEGPIGSFGLQSRVVGQTPDGDAITACVIVPEDRSGPAKEKTPRLSAGASIALDALRYALDETGAPPPPGSTHIPSGVERVVLIDQWRTYAYQKGISTSEEPRARQLAFKRGSEALIAAGRVGVWRPYAWLIN